MAVSLEKYAQMLDDRDEPRPAGPEPVPFKKAKPFLPRLREIKGVIWGGYGTLMLISGGEPFLLNPDPIMRSIALDKTIHEFHMWASMSRKPGEPHVYMASIIQQVVDRLSPLLVKDAEVRFDHVWRGVLDRLFQKEYCYEKATYGEVDDYCQKICYYYLLRSQGVSVFADELETLRDVQSRGFKQGIHADGQCNAAVQLTRCLLAQGKLESSSELFDPKLQVWSYQVGCKKHSDRSFMHLLKNLRDHHLEASDVLYVGSGIQREIAPAKQRGFRTALFVGDRQAAKVTPEQLKTARYKPDALLTEFPQILQVLPS